jgi:hypothetical protein
MDIDILVQSYENIQSVSRMLRGLIKEYDDGYVYIASIRCYGSITYQTHRNIHSLQELCYEYNGDNGIVDVYHNSKITIPLKNYSGSTQKVPPELINEMLQENNSYGIEAVLKKFFGEID